MVVKITPEQHYWVTLVGAVFVTFLYYSLAYWIWPLFRKRKWFWAIFSLVVFYAIAITLRTYHLSLVINWYNLHTSAVAGGQFWEQLYQTQFNTISFSRILFSGLSSLIVIVYVPLSIKFMRYVYQSNQQKAWMLKENAKLQLDTLKAQINPHFFFNTLNNLQSFIVQNEKEKSVNLLNRLADFMRNSLYEGEKEFISLEKEVELLASYINIEKVRFEEDAQISFSLDENYPNYHLPTFMFLPFVENAFKHGGNLPNHQINIDIELQQDEKQLRFKASNAFLTNSKPTLGGIGLQNVKKRLEHYFPNRYQLDIVATGNIFTVNLLINK